MKRLREREPTSAGKGKAAPGEPGPRRRPRLQQQQQQQPVPATLQAQAEGPFPFEQLPAELQEHVISFLPLSAYPAVASASKGMQKVAYRPLVHRYRLSDAHRRKCAASKEACYQILLDAIRKKDETTVRSFCLEQPSVLDLARPDVPRDLLFSRYGISRYWQHLTAPGHALSYPIGLAIALKSPTMVLLLARCMKTRAKALPPDIAARLINYAMLTFRGLTPQEKWGTTPSGLKKIVRALIEAFPRPPRGGLSREVDNPLTVARTNYYHALARPLLAAGYHPDEHAHANKERTERQAAAEDAKQELHEDPKKERWPYANATYWLQLYNDMQ
jgi:hypothetical protein